MYIYESSFFLLGIVGFTDPVIIEKLANGVDTRRWKYGTLVNI